MFNLLKIELVDIFSYIKVKGLIYRLILFGREVIMFLFLILVLELKLWLWYVELDVKVLISLLLESYRF